MQPLAAQFKNYLTKQKLSHSTLKNYVCDADQFLRRLAGNLQVETIKPAQLSPAVFDDYRSFLNDSQNRVNPATAQRSLASLKRFGAFLVYSRLADSDPAAKLQTAVIDPTVNQIVNDFKHALVRQNLSASTIKNYVSDVKNYLNWALENVKITGDHLLIR